MANTPSMFFAYASRPLDVAESIESAIEELNAGDVVRVEGWKALAGTGKVLIQEITDSIDSADIFGCDLTTLNANVIFELGYAIGKERRIWISVSEVIDSERWGARRIEALVPVGHARYVNKNDFVSKLYSEQPWADLEEVLGGTGARRSPVRRKTASLLYLKSPKATDSSIALAQELESSNLFGEQVIDDPKEVPHESLDWYIEKTRRADAVVVHLLSNDSESTAQHNAKCSLVAGLALGLGTPVCMLAHAPFRAVPGMLDIAARGC